MDTRLSKVDAESHEKTKLTNATEPGSENKAGHRPLAVEPGSEKMDHMTLVPIP